MTDPTTPADTLRERYERLDAILQERDAELERLRGELKQARDRSVENGKEICRKLNEVDRLTRERDEARAVVLPEDWRQRIGIAFDSAWHYRSARALVEELVESWHTTPTTKETHDA